MVENSLRDVLAALTAGPIFDSLNYVVLRHFRVLFAKAASPTPSRNPLRPAVASFLRLPQNSRRDPAGLCISFPGRTILNSPLIMSSVLLRLVTTTCGSRHLTSAKGCAAART